MSVAASEIALLVSPDELQAATLGSLKLDVSDDGEREQAAIALAEAQELLESHLDRLLLVQQHEVPGYHEWDYCLSHQAYSAVLRQWPFVESSVTDLVAKAPAKGAQLVFRDVRRSAGKVEYYFGGFRGNHHVLLDEVEAVPEGKVDLNAADGLNVGLTVLPPLLPSLLRGVITDLAYVHLDKRRSSTLGGKRATQFLPSGNVLSEGYRQSAEMEILKRADAYRRFTL